MSLLEEEHTRQLVVQCQTISPENMHTSNVMWTWQLIFRTVCVCVCTHTYMVHAITNSGKEVMNLKENGEVYMGGSGGRNVNIVSQIKRK